tara:strand:+ start:164 stop:745 length:582 start_codon:yes stop_codon:yes gene_type:complete
MRVRLPPCLPKRKETQMIGSIIFWLIFAYIGLSALSAGMTWFKTVSDITAWKKELPGLAGLIFRLLRHMQMTTEPRLRCQIYDHNFVKMRRFGYRSMTSPEFRDYNVSGSYSVNMNTFMRVTYEGTACLCCHEIASDSAWKEIDKVGITHRGLPDGVFMKLPSYIPSQTAEELTMLYSNPVAKPTRRVRVGTP